MKGIIVSSRYSMFQVFSDGVIYNVTLRGLIKSKDRVLVGDEVEVDSNYAVITKVFPRKNALKRPSISNIDQLFIIQSLKEPDFSFLLVYKYLTYAKINNIKPILIITQIDKDKDCSLISSIKNEFQKSDLDIYFVSNKSKEGIEEIKPLFSNKISCLLGQTGVGKSSLLNSINSDYQRDVGEYSAFLHRGKHKTKEVVLLPFEGGFIADTPGFSSLDLCLNKKELAQFFSPFNDNSVKCYYSDCLHVSENNCEIKRLLAKGEISNIAYECYLKLLEEARD